MSDDLLYEECPACKGERKIEEVLETAYYGTIPTLRTCEICDGSGKILKDTEMKIEKNPLIY